MRPKRLNHTSTELLSSLPRHPESSPQTRYEARKARREYDNGNQTRLKRLLGGAALVTAVGLSTIADVSSQHISRDIEQGKEAVRDSQPEVHEIYRYTDTDPALNIHGTFVLTGLGTKDPSSTAEILHPHKDTGDVFALEYSNQDLNIADMAELVVHRAKENDLKEITFDGYSVGGPIALDIAAHIHTNEPDLHVNSVILNSSPVGEGSLTDESRRGVEVMNRVLSIYPDFIYYEDGRAMVEIVNRSERYLTREDYHLTQSPRVLAEDQFHVGGSLYTLDYDSLRYDIEDVRQKMEDPSVASASLIKSQADFITMTDYDSNIKKLSQPGLNSINDTPPLIVYTRSRFSHDDQVVDVDASEDSIVESLSKHGASYMVLRDDVGHANPDERRDEYHHMIESRINPRITGRLAYSMLKYEEDETRDSTRVTDRARQSDEE